MSDGKELGWDDVIENDGEAFVTLPAGEYKFTVKKFDRARFTGSAKITPCNQANITVEIDGGELGTATITEKLKLHSILEWVLCQFFTCIGDRKSGEKLVMKWGEVTGKTGLCDVGVRKYGDNNEKSINTVNKWLEPKEQADFTPGNF